jgi:hypothetical protein
MSDRMPSSDRIGSDHPTDVGYLAFTYEKWQAGTPTFPNSSERTVLGIGLPWWQRKITWTDEQCTRFISSIWRGLNIGSWMINIVDFGPSNPLDGIVIDGQQRLTALQRYFDNEIPFAANDGQLLLWGELTTTERRRFLRSPFPHIEVRLTDEQRLIDLYNLLNFSGSPHTAADRPDPSNRTRHLAPSSDAEQATEADAQHEESPSPRG